MKNPCRYSSSSKASDTAKISATVEDRATHDCFEGGSGQLEIVANINSLDKRVPSELICISSGTRITYTYNSSAPANREQEEWKSIIRQAAPSAVTTLR